MGTEASRLGCGTEHDPVVEDAGWICGCSEEATDEWTRVMQSADDWAWKTTVEEEIRGTLSHSMLCCGKHVLISMMLWLNSIDGVYRMIVPGLHPVGPLSTVSNQVGCPTITLPRVSLPSWYDRETWPKLCTLTLDHVIVANMQFCRK